MTLTPADARSVAFPTASRLRRGYDADEVDAFLERIAVRLETGAGVSSNDVYHVSFPRSGIGGRGYVEADVDAFLEQAHAELARLEDAWGHRGGPTPGDTDGDPTPSADSTDTHTDLLTQPARLPADGGAVAEIAVDDDAAGGRSQPAVR
ncbi:MAG: DivIVA domain-containing protein [Nakamurella sp.]